MKIRETIANLLWSAYAKTEKNITYSSIKIDSIIFSIFHKLGFFFSRVLSEINCKAIKVKKFWTKSCLYQIFYSRVLEKNFSEIVLSQNQGLPKIPVDGVKLHLINPNFICWWNTLLKILATTEVYDSLFEIDIDQLGYSQKRTLGLKKFKNRLKAMVIRMRTAQSGEWVSKKAYNDLLYSLKEVLDKPLAKGDAIDLLSEVLGKFGLMTKSVSRTEEIPQKVSSFSVKSLSIRYEKGTFGTAEEKIILERSYIFPRLTYNHLSNHHIDLGLLGNVETTTDYDLRNLYIHLPSNLLIDIITPNNNPVEVLIDDLNQGQIHLVEFDPHSLKPKFDCFYQIQGFTPNTPGHATYMECTLSGDYILHDDSKISKCSIEEAQGMLKFANTFLLKLLKKVPKE